MSHGYGLGKAFWLFVKCVWHNVIRHFEYLCHCLAEKNVKWSVRTGRGFNYQMLQVLWFLIYTKFRKQQQYWVFIYIYFFPLNFAGSISSNRTPFILNGSDLNMNCTLNQTKTKNASDIIWTACSNSLESIPIAEQYSVELIDGRTSSIRIKNLPMRGNAIYFQCVLQDSGQCDDFDHLVEVYVARKSNMKSVLTH